MNAAQSHNYLYARSTSANYPFHGKERMRPPTGEKLCFAFNRGEPCYTRPCGYRHSCKNCGGRHSFTKCAVRFRNQRTQPAPAYSACPRPQKTNPQFIPLKQSHACPRQSSNPQRASNWLRPCCVRITCVWIQYGILA